MPAREKMLGHPARGDAADGKYCTTHRPATAASRFEAKKGDYCTTSRRLILYCKRNGTWRTSHIGST